MVKSVSYFDMMKATGLLPAFVFYTFSLLPYPGIKTSPYSYGETCMPSFTRLLFILLRF